MQAVTVKITNDYSDGHHSESEVVIEAPDFIPDYSEWFEDVVYQHTGDGHGIDFDGGSCYTATVTACDDPNLLGVEHEWID